MAANITEVTDASFTTEVLQSDNPVLVDFWAVWCAPCRAIAPVVEGLANTFDGKLKVVKMNIDDHPQTPGSLGIRAIPTLLVFKGGRPVDQIVGAVSKDKLEAMVQKHV
jgi:thioredoxin 1